MRLRLYSFLMGLVVEFYSVLCICTEECKYDEMQRITADTIRCSVCSTPYPIQFIQHSLSRT